MPKYSKQEINLIYQSRDKGLLPAQTVGVLQQHGFERTNRQISDFLYDRAKKPRAKTQAPEMYKDTVENLKEYRDRVINVDQSHFVQVGRPTEKASTKILVLTDLHIPFQLDSVIEHAMTHHSDADTLVIGGDFIEAYSVSAFRKNKAILFRWEYETALEYVKMFSSIFPRVILVSGNHERRVKRYVTDNLGNMLQGLVQDDPMAALADGMDYGADNKLIKTYDFPNVVHDSYPRGDYIKIGQCIIAHPNNYSTVPMRTAINAAESFLGVEDFQCFVMGHTHAQGHLVWRNRLLIEAGCCCMPLEYSFATGRLAKLPQTFGYVVVYMDKEGNVDFDQTRAVYQGIGRIIKPPTGV